MDKNTAVFVAVVLVLVLYFLTESTFLLAVIAALGLLYILPLEQLPKLLGYIVISDVMFSVWLMHMAAGTFGGFQVVVLTALVYAVLSRELRLAWGTELLAINGQTHFFKQVRVLGAYGIAWFQALGASIGNNDFVSPEPPTFEWVQGQVPGGWKATRLYSALSAAWYALIPGRKT